MANQNQYDLVFSLGQLCACSQVLRVANLQFASYPLDWVSGGTVESRAALIASRFEGWLEREDFEYVCPNPKQNGLGIYENRRTGFRHPHDFADVSMGASYEAVREKYRRRAERLCGQISRSRRVLCVCIAPPETQPATVAELASARNILSAAYPGVSFDVIYFSCENGLSFAGRRVETPSEGVTMIAFDYRDAVSNVDIPRAAQALAELGVAAVDPRSAAERSAYARRKAREERRSKREYKLRRKMDKYGVRTRAGLMAARLWAFFLRLLGRKGGDAPADLRHFDLVFSLGEACACSQTLRRCRLQFASFPLDWMAGGTFLGRVRLVADRFDGWLEAEDFTYKGANPINGLGIFYNSRTGITHLHDFPDRPVEEGLPAVREKYARRSARLYRLAGESRRVLCVYLSRPAGPELPLQDLVEARRILSKAFPGASVTLLHVRCEQGRAFPDRQVIVPADGVMQLVFDYSARDSDMDMYLVANAVNALGLSVRDYRTAAERDAFDRRGKGNSAR